MNLTIERQPSLPAARYGAPTAKKQFMFAKGADGKAYSYQARRCE
jgi:hypothetical protein